MAQIDGRNPRPSATLEEVAHAAGVSRATVSRVVNGSPKVSPDVRRSVEREIARLGYVPNRAARSLVTRRSDLGRRGHHRARRADCSSIRSSRASCASISGGAVGRATCNSSCSCRSEVGTRPAPRTT